MNPTIDPIDATPGASAPTTRWRSDRRILAIVLAGAAVLASCSLVSNDAATTAGSALSSSTDTASADSTPSDSSASDNSSSSGASAAAASVDVATVGVELAESHDVATDHEWDASTEVAVTLMDGASAGGEGVSVDGDVVSITAAGTYRLAGNLSDGQVVVDTDEDGIVRLVIDGVDINNSTGSALAILDADIAMVVVADGSTNSLSDQTPYVFPDAETDEPNATLFSSADLTITGTGTLTIEANENDGIASKDGLVIDSATIVVQAVDDAIRGKDYLIVNGGTITVTSGDEGLKSDNEEDADMGYVLVGGGTITIDAGGKGISAQANAVVVGGDLTVTSVDDAIHSNSNVTVGSGNLTLTSGDDGIHGDATVTIIDGVITVIDSYEGIESAVITIDGGTIDVTASDDGINVAGGNDGSGATPGGRGGRQQDSFSSSGGYLLTINGGTVAVDARGDGLDANGSIVMTGGTVVVQGPDGNGNGALDYDAGFELTGGTLLAIGSSGMAQTPQSSSQAVISARFGSNQSAGTVIDIEASDGETLFTIEATKAFGSVIFTSPDLVAGMSYTIVVDGTSAGSVTAA